MVWTTWAHPEEVSRISRSRSMNDYQDRNARELAVAYEVIHSKDCRSVECEQQRKDLTEMFYERVEEEYDEDVAIQLRRHIEAGSFDQVFDILDGKTSV